VSIQDKRVENETAFAIERVINPTRVAEGSTLPPPLRGEFRVPLVQNLSLLRTQSYQGGTQFTLTWDNPQEFVDLVSHYNIYVIGLLDNSTTPMGPWQAERAPAEVRVQGRSATNITLIVQTELNNGLKSLLLRSPSVGGIMTAASLVPSDFDDESVPLTAIESGTLDYILTAQGAGVAVEWKSATAYHDLVKGYANLTNVGKVLITDSAGTAGEAANLQVANNALDIDMGIDLKSVSIAVGDSPYSLGAQIVVYVDASGGDVTVNLPSASARGDRTYWVKKTDSSGNVVILSPDGADTFEGESDAEIRTEGESLTFHSDGTSNWSVI
jgi:hypothetical protein